MCTCVNVKRQLVEWVPVREVIPIQALVAAHLLTDHGKPGLPANSLSLAGVEADCLDHAAAFAGVKADGAHYTTTRLLHSTLRVDLQDEVVLRRSFVLQAARFAAVGERRQGLRVQALLLQRVVDGPHRTVADDGYIGKPNLGKIRSD